MDISVVNLCEKFENVYTKPNPSLPPLGNKLDPLDELVYIVLTLMTEYGVDQVFKQLKEDYPTWLDLLCSSEEECYFLLKPLGLVNQRSNKIFAILQELYNEFGEVSLDPLYDYPDREAEEFLISLHGVGKKTARCVMMYSLRRDVFPVDTHVYRLSKRLGLIPGSVSWQKSHDLLQDLVPPECRFSLHVNMVIHGREYCKSKRPLCEKCFLVGICHNISDVGVD